MYGDDIMLVQSYSSRTMRCKCQKCTLVCTGACWCMVEDAVSGSNIQWICTGILLDNEATCFWLVSHGNLKIINSCWLHNNSITTLKMHCIACYLVLCNACVSSTMSGAYKVFTVLVYFLCRVMSKTTKNPCIKITFLYFRIKVLFFQNSNWYYWTPWLWKCGWRHQNHKPMSNRNEEIVNFIFLMAAILNCHFEIFLCKIQLGNKQIRIQQVKKHKTKFVTNFYPKLPLALLKNVFSHIRPSLFNADPPLKQNWVIVPCLLWLPYEWRFMPRKVTTRITGYIGPIVKWCWTTVCDAWPTLFQPKPFRLLTTNIIVDIFFSEYF